MFDKGFHKPNLEGFSGATKYNMARVRYTFVGENLQSFENQKNEK